MDKVYRRLSSTPVPLCFELQVEKIEFPDLDSEEYVDCIVTLNRTGQFENYSLPHNVVPLESAEKNSDDEGDEGKEPVSGKRSAAHFENEKLYMFSTLYSSKNTYLPKRGEIGVFLKKVGAEKYTRAGKITLELNKFGTGKTLELNALFSHKSIDHNIDISKAMMKFSLTAMSREQATELQTKAALNNSHPKEDTETDAVSDDGSDDMPADAGGRARSVINEEDEEDADGGEPSSVFCYVMC